MKIGDKCATWNCKGKVIGDSKREDGSWMDVKCAICGRKYWHNNMLETTNEGVKDDGGF